MEYVSDQQKFGIENKWKTWLGTSDFLPTLRAVISQKERAGSDAMASGDYCPSSPSSSFSSESSASASSMSLSSNFPATSSSPFALSSPFGTTTATSSFSSIFSAEYPASVSKSLPSSPKIFNPSKTFIATSSTSGSLSSVSHATVSSNLFSSAPPSSSSSGSPLSTVLSVHNSASGLSTIAVSSSDSAQSSSASNSSSSPASDFVAKSTSPSPLFSTVTGASTAAPIPSFGIANLFAVSSLSAAKLTPPSPLFSTVTTTSASAPSAVASSSLVSSTSGVDCSLSATAVSGSVSSLTGSSLAAATSAPASSSQAQSTATTAPLSCLGFASPFFATWSGFRFQNSSSSFTTSSLTRSSPASTSGFSLGTSSASTSSFSFGTSSSTPFQSAFSLKNVPPPTSNIFAAKSTSSLPLFSTITTDASTPTSVASVTAASTISSPAFGVSSFAPATTASTDGFSRTTSSFTGFGGGNRSAAFGGFNSFTKFSTKISAPTSTLQTQSTTAPLLCPPSRGSFLPVQTTKNKKRKWECKTPNGKAPGFKHCAENVESSPQQEVPCKSSRLSAEDSRKTTPQLTPANGNSGKMEEENYSKGLALQEIPSLGMHDLGERTTLQQGEAKHIEKENLEGRSPSDAISKAFKDCATVMSSLADLDAHVKDLSGYKVKYFALKSEMEAAAIAWKDKEAFLVQVHRNLYDEIRALQSSNQSLKSSNKELAGKCKQKDSQINGLKEKIKGMSEDLSWKEKQLSLSVKEEELRGIRRLTQYQTLMINEIIKKYPKVDVEDLKRVYCPKVEGESIKLGGQASDEPQDTEEVA